MEIILIFCGVFFIIAIYALIAYFVPNNKFSSLFKKRVEVVKIQFLSDNQISILGNGFDKIDRTDREQIMKDVEKALTKASYKSILLKK